MDAVKNTIIIVNGKDKTDAIVSCKFIGSKCNIVYDNSDKVYSYHAANVRQLKLIQIIDPKTAILKQRGEPLLGIFRVPRFKRLAV